MKNLAGVEECDRDIRSELTRACIDIEEVPKGNSEVPYTLEGRLGALTFHRAWYYWVVNGPVSLKIAQELYAHPEGKANVRVAGHCGCPAPQTPWIEDIDGVGYVTTYHIDTQAGLLLFAQKVKKMYIEKWAND